MAITKEFLKNLGIETEAIEEIFKERGKEITAEKEKLTETENKLTAANNKLSALEVEIGELKKVDAEGMQNKISELEKQIADRKAEDEKAVYEENMKGRFDSVVGEGKFVNELTRKGIYEEFKAEIEKDENKGKGDSDIYAALTKDREGIFASSNPLVDVPGTGTGITDMSISDENAARAVMGLPPITQK